MLSVSDKRNFLVCIFCVFYFLCISSCILYCVVASICKMLLPGLVGAICRQLKLPADKIWQHGRSSKSDQATVFFKERKRFISCLFLLSTDRFSIYLDISYLWIWSRVFGPTLTLNVSIFGVTFLSLCQMCSAS